MPLIVFASPKGGVGKTTLAAHVAALLADRGHRVLALDLDPQNALRLQFGLPLQEEAGFLAGLAQRTPWRAATRETGFGLKVLPHGTLEPLPTLELGQLLLAEPDRLAVPVREMLADPDLVVVADTPPGPSPAMGAIAPLVDLLAVVLLADAASAAQIPAIVTNRFLGSGRLAARAPERTAVILNQVDLDAPLGRAVFDAARDALGSRLLGGVCRDEAVAEALAHKRLLLDREAGPAAEDLAAVADVIVERLRLVPPGRRPAAFPALSDWGLR